MQICHYMRSYCKLSHKTMQTISYKDSVYTLIPVKTPRIDSWDDIIQIMKDALKNTVKTGDIITIAESVVAISQNRAYKFDEIQPRKLAYVLARFVSKVPYGIGLGSPQTMELALQEVGVIRILFAAIFGGLVKYVGIKGMFYRLAGPRAGIIDGPCEYKLPPYNTYATLGPKDPKKVSKRVEQSLGVPVAIVDANDLGVNIVGISKNQYKTLVKNVMKGNPAGQSCEQTPLVIIRPRNYT